MHAKWLTYFLFFTCLTHVNVLLGDPLEDQSPMVVRLSTESSLAPLYVSPLINNQSEFSDHYLKQLEQVLSFDLNYNGSTLVVKRTPDQDQLLLSQPFESMGKGSDWKGSHILYVVKASVQGKSLIAMLFDVNKQSLKSTEPILLSGELSQDRRHIHKLADTIHKAFFGIDGIASTHILYTVKMKTQDPKKWVSEVWEADYDGGNARQITRNNEYCVTPTYIPPKPGYTTGNFMYVSYQIGQPKIYVANLKDGIGHRLTYLRGNQLMPSVSRQRDKIAFISDVRFNPDLFVQPFSAETGAIGKPQQVFAATQATQGSPTFSPDGNQIAFVSDKDGSPRIYVINIPAPGSSIKDVKPQLITKKNRENSAPCWSPDGSKIAYCARTNGERQVWVYDFNTKQEKQLTEGAGNKENPSWAPNSVHLVFNSSDANATHLYLINLNQAEAKQITFGQEEKRFPSWEPRIK